MNISNHVLLYCKKFLQCNVSKNKVVSKYTDFTKKDIVNKKLQAIKRIKIEAI